MEKWVSWDQPLSVLQPVLGGFLRKFPAVNCTQSPGEGVTPMQPC